MTDSLTHLVDTFAAAGPLHLVALLILASLGLAAFALYVVLATIKGMSRGKR